MKKNIFTLVLLLSSLPQVKADAPSEKKALSITDQTDSKNTRSIQQFMNDTEEKPSAANPLPNADDSILMEDMPEVTKSSESPLTYSEIPQSSPETDINKEQIISDIPAKELAPYIDTTENADARLAMESKKKPSLQEESFSAKTETKPETDVPTMETNTLLPAPTMIGGWTGLAHKEKETIKDSNTWKNLKANHPSATDPELYRLYLAKTNKKETVPTAPKTEKITDQNNTQNSKTKTAATPEELYVTVLRKAEPNLSATELEERIEEFRKSLEVLTLSSQNTSQSSSDFSNTVLVAPTKKIDDEKEEQQNETVKKEITTPKEEVLSAKEEIIEPTPLSTPTIEDIVPTTNAATESSKLIDLEPDFSESSESLSDQRQSETLPAEPALSVTLPTTMEPSSEPTNLSSDMTEKNLQEKTITTPMELPTIDR